MRSENINKLLSIIYKDVLIKEEQQNCPLHAGTRAPSPSWNEKPARYIIRRPSHTYLEPFLFFPHILRCSSNIFHISREQNDQGTAWSERGHVYLTTMRHRQISFEVVKKTLLWHRVVKTSTKNYLSCSIFFGLLSRVNKEFIPFKVSEILRDGVCGTDIICMKKKGEMILKRNKEKWYNKSKRPELLLEAGNQ